MWAAQGFRAVNPVSYCMGMTYYFSAYPHVPSNIHSIWESATFPHTRLSTWDIDDTKKVGYQQVGRARPESVDPDPSSSSSRLLLHLSGLSSS